MTMGSRRKQIVAQGAVVIGALALAGVAPFSGFFSKDEILASLHGKGWTQKRRFRLSRACLSGR